MRIEPINGRSFFGPEWCLTGVSAALAEARRVFREAAPELNWPAVTAEVARVRAQDSLTLLDALNVVYQRLTTGAWEPQSAR